MSDLPLIARARLHASRTAIVDGAGEHSYARLLDASARIASALLGGKLRSGSQLSALPPQPQMRRREVGIGVNDLKAQPVPFLVTPGFPWVAVQWGIWRAGGIAVPLPMGSPAAELAYFLDDTGARTIIADAPGAELLAPLAAARGMRLLSCDEALASNTAPLPEVGVTQPAMILYTSGTTSRPKGVVTTHANLEAQITTLVRAWQWSENDCALLCLPLHHVHGIINVVSCALWAGATCEMLCPSKPTSAPLPRFDAGAVWECIGSGRLTVFMAVPTIYARLIAAWEAASPERRARLSEACGRMRLMVSGSAALPVSTLHRWRQISGHTLLERYGMTEIGMALSNPLEGPRVAGSVGVPLPGVELRLVDEHGAPAGAGPGEIEVRGPGVFQEYWHRPEATRAAFRDGWFRTGDVAVMEEGRYRILGRMNLDIIKTGGHKVSALEIEEQLREHPAIAECAVVGVPDPEWGERVAAAVVLRAGAALDLESLRLWAKQRLAAYKIPSRLRVVDALPRNAMGKVTKPAVVAMFKPD
jgi:malonyl-CoA/methylmalonyl-CoA synthetase